MVAPSELNRLQILFMGGPAIDFRMVMGQVLWPVLVHNIDVGIDGDFFGNESKDLFGRSDPPGHDKMPDEEALFATPSELKVRSPTWRCISLRTFLITSG